MRQSLKNRLAGLELKNRPAKRIIVLYEHKDGWYDRNADKVISDEEVNRSDRYLCITYH